MSEPGSRRGRTHDAEGAREAILNAAEEVFAQHGFDGARVDAIAATAGYNKSLIFQYFGDKLGLYAEVIRRADRQMTELQTQVVALLEDEILTSDAYKFKVLLEKIIQALFDYLLEHPRFLRMMLWEQAEGWQTYAKIISQFDTEDAELFQTLFDKARHAGFIRSDFTPLIQLTMVLQICMSHLSFIPLYQMVLPGEDVSSAAALARARKYIVNFVIHGIMIDPQEAKPQEGG
jgi:TetR/AcrR family transcriptional regulator